MTWNVVVVLGVAVTLAAIYIGRGVRGASAEALRWRYRWAVRLTFGYGAVLLAGVVVALGRFAWASLAGEVGLEQRAELLAPAVAGAFNLVLGFLIFGMAPALVAFRVGRLLPSDAE